MSVNKIYYSNDCNHCNQLLSFFREKGLLDRFSYICIDNRHIDPRTNTLSVILKNGQVVPIPIHIIKVPALLILDDPQNKNVAVIGFNAIAARYGRIIEQNTTTATAGHGEPQPANSVSGSVGVSVNLTPAPLSLTQILPQNNSGNRIKDGDITIDELIAKRKLEEAEINGTAQS
jgi:hypothetical protein